MDYDNLINAIKGNLPAGSTYSEDSIKAVADFLGELKLNGKSEEEVKKVSANKFGERLKYSWLKYYYYMKQPSDVDVFYNNNLFLIFFLYL